MRTITVAIGREINAPYSGYKAANGKKAWMLHEEDWQEFQERTSLVIGDFGKILFSGQTIGRNTETGDIEPSFVVCIEYVADFARNGGISSLQERMAKLCAEYGQACFGFIDGWSELVEAERA